METKRNFDVVIVGAGIFRATSALKLNRCGYQAAVLEPSPLLGGWVADAVEGKPNPELTKFRWRDLPPDTPGEEASRFRDEL